jgi:uncharacterized membrane protein
MHIQKQKTRISDMDRWASLVGGSALVAYGLTCRSRTGKALAVVGSNFLYRGVTGEGHLYQALQNRGKSLPYGQGIKVRHSVTVNKSPEELYSFWRGLENLPRFMNHLESVEWLDNNRTHWKVKAPAGMTVQWDAEIISDTPGEMIGWRSLPGAQVDNAGSVRFERAPGGRGTIVRVQLQYNPPGGKAGSLIARLFGEEPEQQLREDLRRFKQIIEAGELPTTNGQPSGTGVRTRENGIHVSERRSAPYALEPSTEGALS